MNPPDLDLVLVDNEPRVLHALRRAIERSGCASAGETRVKVFSSAPAALAYLHLERADLVLATYRMAEMDGVELLRRARELRPWAGRILLSAPADFGFLLKAVNPAAVGRVLLKPWVDEELLGAVRQGVELGQLLRENAHLAGQLLAQRGRAAPADAPPCRPGAHAAPIQPAPARPAPI